MIINAAVYQGYLRPEGWSGASLPDRANFIALALMDLAFLTAPSTNVPARAPHA